MGNPNAKDRPPAHIFVSKPAKAGAKPIRYLARRPEVLPFITNIFDTHYGACLQCSGSAADLIGAHLVQPWMLKGMAKKQQRSHEDGYGNKYVIAAKAGGIFDVSVYLLQDEDAELNDPRTRKLKWWRDNGAAFDADVAAILRRFRAK